MSVNLIDENNYSEIMNEEIIPALEKIRVSGSFERIAGETIRYEAFDAENPKAIVTILHGFSESMLKFYEPAWYFLQNGYSVRMIEHRGHGNSCRFTDDTSKVHLPNYHDLILDVHYFVKHIIKPANTAGLPIYLYAHSMGGGIGACILEHYPSDFKKAVLTAPMLELNSGNKPQIAAFAVASVKDRVGKGDDFMVGAGPFSPEPNFENSCSTSEARYNWYHEIKNAHPEYQTAGSTWKTAIELLRITQEAAAHYDYVTAPILLFQAENDSMVCPGGQERFISGISNGRLIRIPGTKHEIYRSGNDILAGYWDEIFTFFG